MFRKLKVGVKTGIVVLGIVVFGCSAFAETVARESTVAEPATLIDSEQMLGQCLEQVQRQYFQVCLPSLSERLLQPAGSFPVVWDSFSPETRKLFRGWIDENGIVHHSVGLYQDYWTDEIVVLDDSGWEIFRIEREKTYDRYDLQREFFDLGEKEVLEDEFTRGVFLPNKIATLVDLIPFVFWDAHVQIEQEIAAREAAEQAGSLRYALEAAPEERTGVSVGMSLVPAPVAPSEGGGMAMASSPPPPPPGGVDGGDGGGGGGSNSNQLVQLTINLPEGFGYMGHIEIFTKGDLIYSNSWDEGANWVPTLGRQTVYWTDPVSSNKAKCFYYIGDGTDTDGDGHSDLYESWIGGTDPDDFEGIDTNSNGITDWLELKIFGDANQTLMVDTDDDNLWNYEEIIVDSMGRLVAMISDPTLKDSDADGLEDWPERMVWHTEPMNPDTDGDGLEDGAEVNGTLKTNPKNSDTTSPIVAFSGN